MSKYALTGNLGGLFSNDALHGLLARQDNLLAASSALSGLSAATRIAEAIDVGGGHGLAKGADSVIAGALSFDSSAKVMGGLCGSVGSSLASAIDTATALDRSTRALGLMDKSFLAPRAYEVAGFSKAMALDHSSHGTFAKTSATSDLLHGMFSMTSVSADKLAQSAIGAPDFFGKSSFAAFQHDLHDALAVSSSIFRNVDPVSQSLGFGFLAGLGEGPIAASLTWTTPHASRRKRRRTDVLAAAVVEAAGRALPEVVVECDVRCIVCSAAIMVSDRSWEWAGPLRAVIRMKAVPFCADCWQLELEDPGLMMRTLRERANPPPRLQFIRGHGTGDAKRRGILRLVKADE